MFPRCVTLAIVFPMAREADASGDVQNKRKTSEAMNAFCRPAGPVECSPRRQGVLLNPQFQMVCERPLPPSAALPLTEGENKTLTLQALISPS